MCYCPLFLFLIVCFFFKQKTAYEMRISDWSSDVCSSDLLRHRHSARDRARPPGRGGADRHRGGAPDPVAPCALHGGAAARHRQGPRRRPFGAWRQGGTESLSAPRPRRGGNRDGFRSEEQTSELQSLMRISYAVFCLKKKNH